MQPRSYSGMKRKHTRGSCWDCHFAAAPNTPTLVFFLYHTSSHSLLHRPSAPSAFLVRLPHHSTCSDHPKTGPDSSQGAIATTARLRVALMQAIAPLAHRHNHQLSFRLHMQHQKENLGTVPIVNKSHKVHRPKTQVSGCTPTVVETDDLPLPPNALPMQLLNDPKHLSTSVTLHDISSLFNDLSTHHPIDSAVRESTDDFAVRLQALLAHGRHQFEHMSNALYGIPSAPSPEMHRRVASQPSPMKPSNVLAGDDWQRHVRRTSRLRCVLSLLIAHSVLYGFLKTTFRATHPMICLQEPSSLALRGKCLPATPTFGRTNPLWVMEMYQLPHYCFGIS